MSASVAHTTTAKESELLVQFRGRLKDVELNEEQQQDSYLLRWIRARDHDLPKAETMLRNSLKWRKDNDIDNLASWKIPPNMQKEFPFVISGMDREGCPVGILPLGSWDVKKVADSGLADTYIRYTDHCMVYQFGEALKSSCSNNNTPVSQIIVVFDMKHYSLRQVTSMAAIETILETVKRFDLNHPETLKLAAIINAPTYFSIIFEIVKRILSAKTLSKAVVFGSNPAKWTPFLLKYIPPESLPTGLGGTNVDAQKVLDTSQVEQEDDHFTTASIAAGSKLTLPVEVTVPDSVLQWCFKIHDHDIGFTITNDSGEELLSARKYKTGQEHSGSVQCKDPGKYSLVFDNSQSRFRSKTIEYAFFVETPGATEQ